jgi:serine/threonine protein phosphatase PrpC
MQIIDGRINSGQILGGSYRHNEDWMAVGPNFAAVFDGATFKGKSSIAKDDFTDAAWCAQTAGHMLSSIIRITHKPNVIYTDICEKLGRAYQAVTKIDPASIDYNRRPSTTMSCAVQFGNTILIIQIGDSPYYC